MRKEDFFEVLGELDDDIVKGAKIPMKKKVTWKVWSTLAACLCFIVVAITIVPSMLSPQESEGGGDGTIVDGSQNILQEAPTLFAKQSVVDAIEQDIQGQDIGNWTETANAVLDFEYVIPIYSTANVAKDSPTILDTLIFDNQYMIPVMSNDECIGTITVVQQENKWVIFAYEHGFDLKTAVNNNKETATCVVEVIQLNGRGFLISSDTEEFVPISGFGISDNMSGEELLNRILENTGISNDTDG